MKSIVADMKALPEWEEIFKGKAAELYPTAKDASHDILHIARVVMAAKKFSALEGADLHIVIPAAYLHDMVNLPKNDPRRKEASKLSAVAAIHYLQEIGYPDIHHAAIGHAIAAHSFSAGIPPETIEAKVVQDADRLDALGAIGIARCFSTNAQMGTAYYCADDFDAKSRDANDKMYAVDHFYIKLLKLPDMMQTEAGRDEARRRASFMRDFLTQMHGEIS